jgi:hypothetical protein
MAIETRDDRRVRLLGLSIVELVFSSRFSGGDPGFALPVQRNQIICD